MLVTYKIYKPDADSHAFVVVSTKKKKKETKSMCDGVRENHFSMLFLR